jgi:hypothetical protein
MTSGFFQTSIDAQPVTPNHGIHHFLRTISIVTFPNRTKKGTAFYFQMMMASVVLAGLTYITVEFYLDDDLVYATTKRMSSPNAYGPCSNGYGSSTLL